MRSAARRRETYVVPRLPEPLITAPDVADDVALADSVSTAMLLVLETLSPVERAVFVLREVFQLSYDEIAESVDKSSATVRQIAKRARDHVAERRPRDTIDTQRRNEVSARFLEAAQTGDLQGLMDVLSPDVVLLTDGGGLRKAALRPIVGVEKVLRFLASVYPEGGTAEQVLVNGGLGVRFTIGGEVVIASARVDDGLITGLYLVRNPEKLRRLEEVELTR
jgi:RNA polymerase sigma-70 factor (ECF subfamily)